MKNTKIFFSILLTAAFLQAGTIQAQDQDNKQKKEKKGWSKKGKGAAVGGGAGAVGRALAAKKAL